MIFTVNLVLNWTIREDITRYLWAVKSASSLEFWPVRSAYVFPRQAKLIGENVADAERTGVYPINEPPFLEDYLYARVLFEETLQNVSEFICPSIELRMALDTMVDSYDDYTFLNHRRDMISFPDEKCHR